MKDKLNQDGTVKTPVTIDMFNVSQAKGSIGATITQAVQQLFASSVSWKRVGDTDDEETTDGIGNDSQNQNTGGGDDNGGGTGNDNEE